MYYKESKLILEKIKNAKNIVLFCHESADLDSIASNLSMAEVLESFGKNVEIYSVGKIRNDFKFVGSTEKIIVKDPNSIDYSKFDLLIGLDVSELKRFGIKKEVNFKGIIINIDHHEFSKYGDINLVDNKAGSTSTILYYLFKDWGLDLKKETLDKILTGIVADTGIFHFSTNSSSFIFRTVAELIDKGGDYEKTLFFVDQCRDLMVYKFWAVAVNKTKIDKNNRFAYTSIPYSIFKKYENYDISTRQISDTFLRGINDTDFCIVLIERKNGEVSVSVRSRTPGFYVIDLVRSLGGGGHLTGGGATIKAENFAKAVKKVLEEARKYARRSEKQSD